MTTTPQYLSLLRTNLERTVEGLDEIVDNGVLKPWMNDHDIEVLVGARNIVTRLKGRVS